MKQINEIRHVKSESYLITWLINNVCTYQCSYCVPELFAGSNHHYDLEDAKRFLSTLSAHLGHNKVHVAFSGGEPTVFPGFIELVGFLHGLGWTVGLSSNGSRSVEYFERLAPMLSYVAFSYHAHYHNENFFRVVNATAWLTDPLVRVMFDPKYWDRCLAVYERLRANPNVSVEAVRLYSHDDPLLGSNGKDVGYTDEQDAWLNSAATSHRRVGWLNRPNHDSQAVTVLEDGTTEWLNAVELVNSKRNQFTGWECDIGKKQLFIDYEGRIRKGNCFQGGWATSIQNFDPATVLEGRTICGVAHCYCVSDVKTPKRRLAAGTAA